MSLSRLVMNLIVDNRFPSIKSLRYVDLSRQLFDNRKASPPSEGQVLTTHTPASDSSKEKDMQAEFAALKMDRIQLPSPIFTFQCSASALNEPRKVDCFPLADGKTLWADQLGRSFLFDAGKWHLEFMPNLHKPKSMPFSLFVPNAGNNYEHDSSLFIMERNPKPEAIGSMQQSYQFEAFVYRKPTMASSKAWLCQLLPPPPFFREPAYWHICPGISSYAVVGGGKHICISVEGFGSYCLDTENYTWSDFGKWTLPFRGKVEYVPELKLWFGLSAKNGQLAAADLSSMDFQPQLMTTLNQFDMPEEWKEYKDSQLVNLGSGRFCIARFFHTRTLKGNSGDYSGRIFSVFTGVEVLPPVCGSKEVELQTILHKSICHISNGTSIDAVF